MKWKTCPVCHPFLSQSVAWSVIFHLWSERYNSFSTNISQRKIDELVFMVLSDVRRFVRTLGNNVNNNMIYVPLAILGESINILEIRSDSLRLIVFFF